MSIALRPVGFFVLRTPLLPFTDWLKWSDGLLASSAAPAALASALMQDRALLRARLRTLLQEAAVREALFLASPGFWGSLPLWQAEPDGKKGQAAERALVRFFSRMAGRATPFGLFAGCSTGTVNAATALTLLPRASYRRKSRIDASYLFALSRALSHDPRILPHLTLRPNSSLYRAGRKFHYVAVEQTDTEEPRPRMMAAKASPALAETLAAAAAGASLDALAQPLASDGTSLDEARAFIRELLLRQILETDLPPPLTGADSAQWIIAKLRSAAAAGKATDALTSVVAELAELDAKGLGQPAESYDRLAQKLAALPAKVDRGRLYQVDLIKPAPAASLGGEALCELLRAVSLLGRLSRPQDSPLLRFRDAFVRRYGDREVPLAEALDHQRGIGFEGPAVDPAQTPLLKGLGLTGSAPELSWSQRDDILYGLVRQALAQGKRCLNLTDAELCSLELCEPLPLPPSLDVLATFAARSPAALDAGEFSVLVRNAGGPPGTRMLARFCHADSDLDVKVRKALADHESAKAALDFDAVFAEIVHLPMERLGNVMSRPLLHAYEIPYLGRSGAPLDRQIPISDLRVSVAFGKVVLRSKRLGRRILPRLTCAQNFYDKRRLPLYRFLCWLSRQGFAAELGWDWGPLAALPALPRLTAGRIVLAPARWRLDVKAQERLSRGQGAERFQLVQRFRAERGLPRYVALAEEDQWLPFDLDNVLCVESLVQLLQEKRSVVLQELFPGPEELCAEGLEGRFVHELLVPLVLDPEAAGQGAARKALPVLPPQPSRQPTSQAQVWLRLYGGPRALDFLLTDVVAPLVKQPQVAAWQSVRVCDGGESYLELTLHGPSQELRGWLLAELPQRTQRALEEGKLYRIVLADSPMR